jgi:hypothetical protein
VRRLTRRSTRERTEWIGAISVTPTVVAVNTNSTANLLTALALEEWPGGRIERLIGQLFVSPATAPAAATGYGVFLGFDIQDAAYDPETAGDHRWIHWDSCFPQIGGNAAADSNASRWVGYFRFNFDLRIRRRYDTDKALALQVKNSASSGASIQYSYAFRILIAAGRK